VGQLEIGLWGALSLLLPPVGIVVALLWKRRDRPGADSCLALATGYLTLLLIIAALIAFWFYFSRPFAVPR
jgi:hypothetical protein